MQNVKEVSSKYNPLEIYTPMMTHLDKHIFFYLNP